MHYSEKTPCIDRCSRDTCNETRTHKPRVTDTYNLQPTIYNLQSKTNLTDTTNKHHLEENEPWYTSPMYSCLAVDKLPRTVDCYLESLPDKDPSHEVVTSYDTGTPSIDVVGTYRPGDKFHTRYGHPGVDSTCGEGHFCYVPARECYMGVGSLPEGTTV